MFDHAAVVTMGGVALWTRANTRQPPPTDDLMHSFIAQGKSQGQADIGAYAVAWATQGQLIFLLASPRLLSLPPYVPSLLMAFVRTFTSSFSNVIDVFTSTKIDMDSVEPLSLRRTVFRSECISNLFLDWDKRFDELVRSAQVQQKQQATSINNNKANNNAASTTNKNGNNPANNANNRDGPLSDSKSYMKSVQANKSGRKGKDSSQKSDNSKKKKTRKWGVDGLPLDIDDQDVQLDYSSNPSSDPESGNTKMDLDQSPLVDTQSMGQRDKQGIYDVASYDDDDESDDDDDNDNDNDNNDEHEEIENKASSSLSHVTRLFSSLGLTSRKLSTSEIQTAVNSMRDHLAKKNVASTVCDQLIEPLSKKLVGQKVSGPGALEKLTRQSMSNTLTHILTPATSTDILQEIKRKLRSGIDGARDPYVFCFCGVNGVGKSTNLAKVAFWLLNNKYRLLIAACDTFRSGAVEQLLTHVKNLQQLDFGNSGDNKNMIEIFQKGYGKDAAGIASMAISHAKENNFDIVLIDTAGRMQDNEPLMKALSKLVTQNKPDKVLFVAEALVGNQGLDQLVSFDNSLKALSPTKDCNGVDGIILTKFDTIDDKVGAAVSMTYSTGKPILFIGTGQTYSDLRSLKVDNIVKALMRE